MTWLNSTFTIEDAGARGQAVWDLLITNWGNTIAPSADGSSLSYPALNTPALQSVAAIAIGPLSTVDRVVVQQDLQKLVVDGAGWDFQHRVTVRSPLTFFQPGNRNSILSVIPGQATLGGTLAVYPRYANRAPQNGPLNDSTHFGNSYWKATGSAGVFGDGSPGFLSPTLHLQFYLQPPGAFPPTERLPFHYQDNVNDLTGAGVETLGFQIPVYGRRRLALWIRDQGVANSTWRVGLLTQLGPLTAALERNAPNGAAIAVAPNVVSSLIIEPVLADYMMIYYTSAAGQAIRATITVLAED